MRSSKNIFFLIILVISLCHTGGDVRAQTGEEYFYQTGHWIKGAFYDYFYSAEDPLLLFGYPITDEFNDPLTGIPTQYFQHSRFDLVPGTDGLLVKQAPLGSLTYVQEDTQSVSPPNSGSCQLFPETGKHVCYSFLDFYRANNGQQFLGNPIVEAEVRDGRYIQYFELARLEWRPDARSGEYIALSDLGRIYFDTNVGSVPADQTIQGSFIIKMVSLNAHAFVTQALIPANSHQSLNIIVQDQDFEPVEGAIIGVAIHLPDGTQEFFRAPTSNADGISQITFAVGDWYEQDIIEIDVNVSYKKLEAHTTSWFRIWW